MDGEIIVKQSYPIHPNLFIRSQFGQHGQCLHQQYKIVAFICKAFLWIVGPHGGTKLSNINKVHRSHLSWR